MYTYIGEWKSGLKHGKGEIKYDDGTRIEATWESGRLNGPGKYFEKGGKAIEATWKNDIMIPLGD
jgi:hypothetical protein